MTDITINKKTDIGIRYQHNESDGTTARTLVGATVYFTVKANPFDADSDDSDALLQKTITDHTNAAGGITTITLTDTDTNIAPGTYFYDVMVKESDGLIYKGAEGRCTISSSVTNRAA